jgi:anti-sigma regulatory factor (Ser/Thr protein kinase)
VVRFATPEAVVVLSISCSFPPTLASTRNARIAVSEVVAAGGLAEPARDALLLILSELVTNAVCHAATPYELVVTIADHTARIEVSDADPTEPQRRRALPDHEGGHGLNLVADLAESWGIGERPDGGTGKTVWAEVDLDHAPTARG